MRPGAAYTALSRARTEDSLTITVDGDVQDAPSVFEDAFITSPPVWDYI